ncbi:hypothetical protein [Streptomyces lonarensis]|uniref:Uncharacterized protein n=1 Tax=Streptomyces lonarensis TaxID=700599 RepID=A0A7X6D0V4_9ACTN|nr:hypothetical protein [Streptomyces lonarensis]NJQ06168.1 hypothetical protein [Streptomyces lonarensis]
MTTGRTERTGRTGRGLRERFAGDGGESAALRMAAFAAALALVFGTAFTVGNLTEPAAPPPVGETTPGGGSGTDPEDGPGGSAPDDGSEGDAPGHGHG